MMRKRHYFEPVDPKVDFSKLEREILDYWGKSGIVKKYLQKNNKSRKYFSFLDGPITANNPMGVHHAWGRTYKDLWQRYKNMQGFKQRFQNGFDCQGLWVEVEVEKELGLKSKKDIENLVPGKKKESIAKFVELCKKRVYKYADIQTNQSKRLGFFMDWDNSYYTMSDENNYMIWYFLKVCHENGWIYKGEDVVPWCPRCETAISQHETLTEDYKEVIHKSIYFRLPIKGRKDEYLLVWTTTPWTIPANTAVAVGKDIDYSLAKIGKGKYWLAKERVGYVFGKGVKIIKTVKGNALAGISYKSPFDYLPYVKNLDKNDLDKFHKVYITDPLIMPITTEEGTGLVHISTGAGQEDYRFGKKIGLPVIPAINDKGEYLENFGDLKGKNAKETPELILDFLEKKGFAVNIEKYKHRYPACWRCKQELVWKVTSEWYVAMDRTPRKDLHGKYSKLTLRERMKGVAKKINWIPSFGLKRELDWLENMDDWLISKKNRYWGLALPIWECEKCNYFEVIGSKEELKKKAVSGWEKFEGKSPHKPQIDELRIRCPKCNKAITRIEPVGNPWLDAGIVSFSTITRNNKGKPLYLTNKSEWKRWFPADFITESFPGQFKNWFYSLIAMSTVLENQEPTKSILGFATLLAEDGRPMHKSWGNAIEFNEGADKIGVDVMRWMYVRQNVTDNLLFGYKKADETRRRFHLKLWNVFSFFVTYANLDCWKPNSSSRFEVQSSKLTVLDRWIVSRLTQTINGVADFLDKYDAYDASGLIEDFVNDLSNWYIRRSRNRVGPASVSKKEKEMFYQTIYFVLSNLAKILAPFLPYLTEIIYTNLTKDQSVHLSNWPKIDTKIDLKLISDMDNIRLIVESAHALRKEMQIPVRQPLSSLTTTVPFEIPEKSLNRYVEEELNVKKWIVKKGEKLTNKYDTKITRELKEESDVRELIRKIQNERKKMGLNLTQSTTIESTWLPASKILVQQILKKTSSINIVKSNKFAVKKSS